MPEPSAPERAFHVSLNVNDLDASLAFYCELLGVEPAKRRRDYAKFELAEPALVLSLEPQRHAPGGSLNHLGLRMPDSAALVEAQRRLELAGISTRREEGVECCYARQTKFWVNDPDRNHWEIYILEEDLEQRGEDKGPASAADSSPDDAAPITWEHRLGEPVPERIPVDAGAADEILLRGSFNANLPTGEIERLLVDARRALRRGGQVTIQALIADGTQQTRPDLPGPAAAVERVPVLDEPLQALERAGFSSIRLERLGTTCCFQHERVHLRELLLVGTHCPDSPFDLTQVVVYRGPFRQVVDDNGTVYPRGVAVAISTAAAELLRDGILAEQFAFLSPGHSACPSESTAAAAPR